MKIFNYEKIGNQNIYIDINDIDLSIIINENDIIIPLRKKVAIKYVNENNNFNHYLPTETSEFENNNYNCLIDINNQNEVINELIYVENGNNCINKDMNMNIFKSQNKSDNINLEYLNNEINMDEIESNYINKDNNIYKSQNIENNINYENLKNENKKLKIQNEQLKIENKTKLNELTKKARK